MSQKLFYAARTWRRFALPLSLVLNLFLGALIAGHLLQGKFGATREGSSLARALAEAESVLSTRDAASFDAVIKRDAPHFIPVAQQLAEARRAIGQEMTADHYDPDAVRHALAEWRLQSNRFLDQFTETLIDAVGQVSAEGRRELIAARRQAEFVRPTRIP